MSRRHARTKRWPRSWIWIGTLHHFSGRGFRGINFVRFYPAPRNPDAWVRQARAAGRTLPPMAQPEAVRAVLAPET